MLERLVFVASGDDETGNVVQQSDPSAGEKSSAERLTSVLRYRSLSSVVGAELMLNVWISDTDVFGGFVCSDRTLYFICRQSDGDGQHG